MVEMEIYQLVYQFAANAHDKRALTPEKRFRKETGIPYITHPVAVKDAAIHRANDFYPPWFRQVFLISLVALLHDVLEDTTVTRNELHSFLDTLLPEFESELVIEAVTLLTKDKENFNIITYLSKIRRNTFATVVKLSDLDHNMSDLKPGNLLDKYKLCHYFLSQ
jgi:(p)ppGpp synthase/HD superfamily hydrolase